VEAAAIAPPVEIAATATLVAATPDQTEAQVELIVPVDPVEQLTETPLTETPLAEAVASWQNNFCALPDEDEAAIALLSSIKGIGRWSAEIYLLFAEGRADIFPAGDLALQIQLGRMLGEDARPTEKRARLLAEPMRPHRGALSILLWHNYNIVAL
jgi:hypothetical protein